MIINKEGKLFGKISIVDIFVVVAILVAAFVVYTRFIAGNEKVDVKNATIEYQIRVKKVRETTVNALKKGGPITDTQTKEPMGEIVNVETTPVFEEQTLADGSIVLSEVKDRYNVIMTVRTEGSANETGYYTAKNKSLHVNSGFVIANKYAETTGDIVAIKEIK